ncbi:MAG: MgtC/SapB family protein [Chloroflexi bacterium]|nr:MgtC/SapB family protein [Chloroflexota bacterium]
MSNEAQLELVARLGLALLLGAIVGLEREFRGHEAGVRTSALVCLGAAMFGEASRSFGDSRVAAGVVQGIGFLGAGVIFQRGDGIRGVTTAATIWAVAAMGLLVAQRMWLSSVVVAVGLVVLLETAPLSNWVFAHRREHARDIDLRSRGPGDIRDRRDETPDR